MDETEQILTVESLKLCNIIFWVKCLILDNYFVDTSLVKVDILKEQAQASAVRSRILTSNSWTLIKYNFLNKYRDPCTLLVLMISKSLG